MRILSVGNFTTGWDGSICDEEHIAKSLEGMGHSVARWQRENREDPYQEGNYDFILIAQWDGYPVDMVKELKSNYSDTPIVYWAFDYQDDGQEWHERLARECDMYLSKPLRDRDKHHKWRWLSQDFAPNFLDRSESEKDIEVLFTGSWVPWESGQERVKVLKDLDANFDLHIYGVTPDQWRAEGFKNVHGPVMDHGLPGLISRAKINFSMDHVISPGYWSDRNAQIMSCGGFVMFRHVPLSEAVFRDNIEYFHNTNDCVEKIKFYLDNPDKAQAIAEKGYQFAQNNLKVDNRVKDLLTIVGEMLV